MRLQVAAAVARTAEWIQPLLTAYLYEGSRHFNGPRQIGGPLASQCVKGGCPDGSDWTAVAQVQPGIPQHAAYNMQHTTSPVQHASHNMHRTTCDVQNEAHRQRRDYGRAGPGSAA